MNNQNQDLSNLSNLRPPENNHPQHLANMSDIDNNFFAENRLGIELESQSVQRSRLIEPSPRINNPAIELQPQGPPNWIDAHDVESSDSSIYSFELPGNLENQPLIERAMVPRIGIAQLIYTLLLYVRIGIAVLIGIYSLWLLISTLMNKSCNNEKDQNGNQSEKCDLTEQSYSSLRIVFSAVVLLVLNPFRLSVISNFFHKKEMLQLQITLIMWIMFIINNAEDGR